MFEYNTLFFLFRGLDGAWVVDHRTQGSLAGTPLSVIFAIFRNSQTYGNKKDVGVKSLRAYP